MELDWSVQSSHIRTLFRPWQPGDGKDGAIIQAAEERLGVDLPATLRNFYLAWGKRRDLMFNDFFLLDSDEVGIEAHALYFCGQTRGVQRLGSAAGGTGGS